jgi:hypothetical protein
MPWWYLLVAAAFGLIVGRWWAVAVGTGTWAAWLYYYDTQHPGAGRLPGNLHFWVPVVLIASIAAAIFIGVAIRFVARRWTARY